MSNKKVSDNFPTFDPSLYNIISIKDILENNPKAVKQISQEFVDKGWCFARMPSEFPSTKNLSSIFGKFFSQGDSVKNKYAGPFGFGYSTVPHKEELRILTGYRLNNFKKNNLIPSDCIKNLEALSFALDDLSLQITDVLSEPLFGCNVSSLALNADLPVAYLHESHFGMLDTAFYFNRKPTELPLPPMGTSVSEVNCVPHYDPGLFSISFLSTNEGLQLQNPKTKEWIAGPINTINGQSDICVIWLGEAAVKASKKGLKAGIHRVVYPRVAAPRLTMWYEVCTVKQATEPDQTYLNGDVTVPNMPGSKPIKVKNGETNLDILKKIERTRGVPMSKVDKFEDKFKYP